MGGSLNLSEENMDVLAQRPHLTWLLKGEFVRWTGIKDISEIENKQCLQRHREYRTMGLEGRSRVAEQCKT